jgi:hypothetical protein
LEREPGSPATAPGRVSSRPSWRFSRECGREYTKLKSSSPLPVPSSQRRQRPLRATARLKLPRSLRRHRQQPRSPPPLPLLSPPRSQSPPRGTACLKLQWPLRAAACLKPQRPLRAAACLKPQRPLRAAAHLKLGRSLDRHRQQLLPSQKLFAQPREYPSPLHYPLGSASLRARPPTSPLQWASRPPRLRPTRARW